MTTPSSKVAIVGAGVFGLSTALHLAKRGYKDVTVFDYQPYHENAYSPENGCDGASSDRNKIYRCSYGDETEYQDLAFSGRPIWLEWNKAISETPAADLPVGIAPDTVLFETCGFMRLANGPTLSAYDAECIASLRKAGLRHHQHVLSNESDMRRLAEKEKADPGSNWKTKIDAFRSFKGGKLDGFMDTSAGLTYADKSCAWARHLCEKAGVEFVLGPEIGKFDELLTEPTGEGNKVVGLRTMDGKEHRADAVVVACGGWTPSVLPEVAGLLEATAGSVITITLPEERDDLWYKASHGTIAARCLLIALQFSPERFPAWAYGLTGHTSDEFGGFYGFPRTSDGKIKIGYRGRKWTNYQTHPKTGQRLSVPKTKYTTDRAVNLPLKAINNIKLVIGEMFPELTEIGITDSRMCFYTDSVDNSFVNAYVPGYEGLFCSSGGSGHGFKFLPVLGEHVVNALERKEDQFTRLWKWRTAGPGVHANGLEEGEMSGRNLATLEMATEEDWVWAKSGAVKVGEKGDALEKEGVRKGAAPNGLGGLESRVEGLAVKA